jgi:hypothetical protein
MHVCLTTNYETRHWGLTPGRSAAGGELDRDGCQSQSHSIAVRLATAGRADRLLHRSVIHPEESCLSAARVLPPRLGRRSAWGSAHSVARMGG